MRTSWVGMIQWGADADSGLCWSTLLASGKLAGQFSRERLKRLQPFQKNRRRVCLQIALKEQALMQGAICDTS